ncbi:hypothetical protein DSM3645_27326 [Blastopirellula marina DSM 3645]|uniref:Uncharacterized protein n=1 Tax=Blastopirellula marina DSM 3645 TaxID=314230 RepID=A4A015_9BACT|nr:hypothetical protein [Blastopirellula marina]EAQ77962.1 hypothetical protein DSM3645_27326 [Blastopirellula marina DSM 3645]
MVIAALVIVIGGGCNTITRRTPRLPWQDKDEEEYGPPAKLVAIWKDSVMVPPGQRATRGFGGRVYFYDATNKPVRVRGTFTVYAFDDDVKGNGNKSKPDRKYVFEECDLQSHYSMSKIGHSYSFWIPWDAVGGEQRCVTLAPYFQAAEGALVSGEQSRTMLLGHVKPEDTLPPAEAIPQGPVAISYDSQPASYAPFSQQPPQQATPQPQPQPQQPPLNREHLRTTTIPVPTTLEQRLLLQNESGMGRPAVQPQQPIAPPAQQQRRNFYQQGASQYVDPQSVQSRAPINGQAYQPWQRLGAGGMHSGVNIRNFRPDFHDANEFSEYMATGRKPTEEVAAAQPAAHFSPAQPQAPSSQNVRQQFSGPQNQPSQSTWPQNLPSQPSR